MNYMMRKLPLLLEFFINGLFILIYTLKKSGRFPQLIDVLPIEDIYSVALFVVPATLFISLACNFLNSVNFKHLIRSYIFSVVIFFPLLIIWGVLGFCYCFSKVHLF